MKIFIGSSKEHQHVAQEICDFLISHNNIEVVPWWKIQPHGMAYFYEELENFSSNHTDAALFVLAPDDNLKSRGRKTKTTRDNVLIEAGLFSGRLGRERTYLCVYDNTIIPSDWHGINYLKIDAKGKWQSTLEDWINNLMRLPFFQPQNVFLSSREEIEKQYDLEMRLGPLNNVAERIESIEFINLACNIALTPDAVSPEHAAYTLLGKYLRELLNGGGIVKISILAPGSEAMYDAANKIRNAQFSNDPKMVIYETYKSVEILINSKQNNPFKKAYHSRPRRFYMYYVDTALPYGIMEVKFKDRYKYMDHIKIDTYCAFLDKENQRRCMLIFKHANLENYQYFSRKVSDIRNNSISEQKLKEYISRLELSS